MGPTMHRRDALRGLCAVGAVGFGGGGRPHCSAQAKEPRARHVLFICIDDLNDWIGVLGGHPQARTPHLDRLAGWGTLFTNAHCAAPSCNPSRVATMTGMRASTTGIYNNDQPFRPAFPDAMTLPQCFRAHGYRAIGSGKIFHGRFPDPDSWDAYSPAPCRPRPSDPGPPRRMKPLNGIRRTRLFDWGPLDAATEDMGDYAVSGWVVDQIARLDDRPTFLACGLFRPHLPFYVPRRFFDRFPLDTIELPRTKMDDLEDVPPMGVEFTRRKSPRDHERILAANQWKPAVRSYLASVNFVDEMLGRVLDAVESHPRKDDIAVVLWSDHGWHLGEKLHWRKFALWEEATRVPLIIVVPGLTKPHGVCDRPVNLLDLYPTLADLAGLDAPTVVEGNGLRPLLEDPEAPWPHVSLSTYERGNHAVRDQHFRYIRYSDGGEELYDHRVDPMEFDNLAASPKLASVKEELRSRLPVMNARSRPKAKKYRRSALPCKGG